MLSNTSNCIFYNSLVNSGSTFDLTTISLWGELRNDADQTRVYNYFYRSEKLVTRIKQIKGHSTGTWSYYKTTYVDDIISSMRNGEYTEAHVKISNMLTSIERELALILWIGGVAGNAYMPVCNKQASALVIGDMCSVLSENLNETLELPIVGIKVSMQSLVTLVSANGVRLTCAEITPMTFAFGAGGSASSALGKSIPVMKNGVFSWELCVDVILNGMGLVYNMQTTPENPCYAAGDNDNEWIWTQHIGPTNDIYI